MTTQRRASKKPKLQQALLNLVEHRLKKKRPSERDRRDVELAVYLLLHSSLAPDTLETTLKRLNKVSSHSVLAQTLLKRLIDSLTRAYITTKR
jgi:hypothetical protein